MNYIRSNIVYSISKLSIFIINMRIDHWITMKRVFKYLRYIMDYELYYIGYPMVLEGYSDDNWIFDTKNLKSTSGYIFTLGGVAMS